MKIVRQLANREIIEIISQYISLNPEMRFGQCLLNLNIVEVDDRGHWEDEYYTESTITLERVKKKVAG